MCGRYYVADDTLKEIEKTVQEVDKRMFQYGIHNNRIVIPAGRFYEWNRQKEKSTFYTRNKTALYMAGFFDEFQDIACFVIITTAANDSMSMVHDRMPLILKENQIENWIMDETQTKNILKQAPEQLYRETEYEQQTIFL